METHFREDGAIESFTGVATGVILEIYMTNGVTELESGEYTYGVRGKKVAKTFVGDVFIELQENGVDTIDNLRDGTLTVKKNKNIYELTFNCTDRTGVKVNGYYKGKLKDV